MMEHTLRLHKGVNRFIQLADDSNEVPNLQGKTYRVFKLSAAEWMKLELMCDVLQVYASFLFLIFVLTILLHNKEPMNAQQSFSATCEPTVWCTIPVLKFLQETWQNMASYSKFNDFSNVIQSGLDNLHKWYHKIDESDVYFICLSMCCI
jgi:hypothetical protein